MGSDKKPSYIEQWAGEAGALEAQVRAQFPAHQQPKGVNFLNVEALAAMMHPSSDLATEGMFVLVVLTIMAHIDQRVERDYMEELIKQCLRLISILTELSAERDVMRGVDPEENPEAYRRVKDMSTLSLMSVNEIRFDLHQKLKMLRVCPGLGDTVS